MNPPSLTPFTPIYCLTGNIGSGKTTVAREFMRLGIPVYFADTAAKRLMNEDGALSKSIRERFGSDTYGADGRLDRAVLAGRVFNDAAALADLNALVHPAVHRDAAAWREANQAAPYQLYEAAITLEIGRADDFSGVIVVAAGEAERQRRVLARDGMTVADFAARASKQWPDKRKEAAADHLIHNRGRDLIFPQILHLHGRLRQC